MKTTLKGSILPISSAHRLGRGIQGYLTLLLRNKEFLIYLIHLISNSLLRGPGISAGLCMSPCRSDYIMHIEKIVGQLAGKLASRFLMCLGV